ncbi:hypothetical protein SAQ01S_18180 [Sphingomonas aquatilis NBRC 16722]|uniref:Uncharacterized protein n=1 Tax=Sphingomonas aquatilis TaxID=93063 RepID=A0AAW3TNQ3_9SPHN|nr:hypothetical protein [Sphingomonas aquatilis]MBB3875278.1 hypothetical protein [Sphingomonas aquatilis]GEM72052.1 hypothetical protein SAQ01S_18180 [Sphingomonas aquatilis NBRC 16722]
MATMTEQKSLADRYEAMAKESGLVDVKFLVSNLAETTNEEVCREVNAMYAALERNEFKVLDFGDRTIN